MKKTYILLNTGKKKNSGLYSEEKRVRPAFTFTISKAIKTMKVKRAERIFEEETHEGSFRSDYLMFRNMLVIPEQVYYGVDHGAMVSPSQLDQTKH